MKLIIVRHAESGGNAEGRMQGHADFPLNDKGRAQAQKLREAFEREQLRPTHIYSSPLKRCAETTQIALGYLSPLSVEYWDDLKEHDMGALSGLTVAEAAVKYPHIDFEAERLNAWNGVPGVETSDLRQARARRVVRTVLDCHENDARVALVSHGGITQYILGALMGTERAWGLAVANTGVFEFAIDKPRWHSNGHDRRNPNNARILRFNDARHLDGMSTAANADVGQTKKG